MKPIQTSDEDEEAKAWFIKHCAVKGAVVACFADQPGKHQIGIFSSLSLAEEWANKMDDGWGFTFVGFMIDDPDFGNVKPH